MRKRRSRRFRVRLILSCLGGIFCAVGMTPYVMPLVRIGNLVVAGILGAVLFLVIAIIAGLIWQRSLMAAPIRWIVAAPALIAVTIYLGLRFSSGFDPSEEELAADASLAAGFCAIFASAIFLVWTRIAPGERDSQR